ncbi:MAG: 2-dehydropantoate 2-reductase [Rudaea sp.]
MRILVVGAGATGGYFGGRLAQSGCDVTFLVRERRAAQIALDGLSIRSPAGDFVLATPRTVSADAIEGSYDLVLLSCKAYDLDAAIESFAPAVGAETAILPLLNGMRHLDALDARFGAGRVLGGLCLIAATLTDAGVIVQLNDTHTLTYGERTGVASERVARIAAAMDGAPFVARASDTIVQDMWEKWMFLATLAASTCLMRAALGDILAAPGGERVIRAILAECQEIATHNGHSPRAPFVAQAESTLTLQGSTLTASMLRDIDRGAAIEADQIVGDLLARRARRDDRASGISLLDTAYSSLKAYEARACRV